MSGVGCQPSPVTGSLQLVAGYLMAQAPPRTLRNAHACGMHQHGRPALIGLMRVCSPPYEVTTCSAEPAWLWFAAYLLFNVFFNLMFLWLSGPGAPSGGLRRCRPRPALGGGVGFAVSGTGHVALG